MSRSSVSPPSPAGDSTALSNIEAFLEEALSHLALDRVEARWPGSGRPRVLPALCPLPPPCPNPIYWSKCGDPRS